MMKRMLQFFANCGYIWTRHSGAKRNCGFHCRINDLQSITCSAEWLTKIQTSSTISQIGYVILTSYESKGVSVAKNFVFFFQQQYSAKSLVTRTNSENLVFATRNVEKKKNRQRHAQKLKTEINSQLPTISEICLLVYFIIRT